MQARLTVEPIVFDGPTTDHGPVLKMTVKRYTPASIEDEGLTLLVTHCIGGHKEQWEPVIQRLFEVQQSKEKKRRIREVYSFDWQSHGESAVLNENALNAYPDCVPPALWSLAIASFVKANRLNDRRVVAIGHSAGAGTLMLTTKAFPKDKPPYIGIVLAEPTMVVEKLYNENIDAHNFATEFADTATMARRDAWSDRESAVKWLSQRQPWKHWDPRVLRVYAEHGLRDMVTQEGNEVKLKCSKLQEARSYAVVAPHIEAAHMMPEVCKTTPIHVIWGTRNDFNPADYQESLCDASEGRVVASVQKVDGAGHLVVQQKPDALADAICNILDTICTTTPSAKL